MKATRITLSEQVRRAVESCGLTRYRIWQETGIDQSLLSKFANGKISLSMDSLDKLADLLELNITVGKPTTKGKRKGKV